MSTRTQDFQLECGCVLRLADDTLLEVKNCRAHSDYAGSAVSVPDCDYARRNRPSRTRRAYR